MANEGSITIEPSVIRERSNTYSSLTDIYGTDVFTSKHEAKVAEFEEEQKEKAQKLGESIFVVDIDEGSRIPSDTKKRQETIKAKIKDIYDNSKQNYGAPKIAKELRK